jgi:hypothetical protein
MYVAKPFMSLNKKCLENNVFKKPVKILFPIKLHLILKCFNSIRKLWNNLVLLKKMLLSVFKTLLGSPPVSITFNQKYIM